MNRMRRWVRFIGMEPCLRWEGLWIRGLFALVVFTTLPVDPVGELPIIGKDGILSPFGRVDYDSQPIPTGIAKFVDLTFIANESLQPWIWGISLVCLAAYVWGRGLAVAIPVLLAITVCARTLQNSQGFMFHKFQIVSTVLLMQAIVAVVYVLWGWYVRAGGKGKPMKRGLDDYLLRYSQIGIVGAYLLAGIAKVDSSGGQWVANSHYFGLDVVRSQRQAYYNRLEGERYREIEPAREMLIHPQRTRLLMGAGLFLEFLGVIALFHRVAALFVGLLLVSFHVQVAQLMEIHFALNEKVVWIFVVNPVFWIGMLGLALWKRYGSRRREG